MPLKHVEDRPPRERALVFFGFTRLEDILAKGNVWYVNHYGSFFDRVMLVYMSGGPADSQEKGKTRLVSLGTGNGFWNLLAAPWRFYCWARDERPSDFLTADMIFSWWTTALVRWALGAKIVLMPVCMPQVVFNSSGRTVSGFPRWMESIFIRLSFATCARVLTGECFGGFVRWLTGWPPAQKKLLVTTTLVEALPTPEFLEALDRRGSDPSPKNEKGSFWLVYVGRLHSEKLVADLVPMLKTLRSMPGGEIFRLRLVGSGPEEASLRQAAQAAGVADHIEFAGRVENADLPRVFDACDVFVSTLTGTSLREAALCGLPIVAYDMDWVHGFLRDEEDALLVPPRDVPAMAGQIHRLSMDKQLRKRLADNAGALARRLWSLESVGRSLEKAFSFND